MKRREKFIKLEREKEKSMNFNRRWIFAIIIYAFLIAIGNWAGGASKDEWDNLMKWTKK